jgi:hypothetical protein
MTKHPIALPDEVVRELADLARANGYGIEEITLTWVTRGLGQPAIGRVNYALNQLAVQKRAEREAAIKAAHEPYE